MLLPGQTVGASGTRDNVNKSGTVPDIPGQLEPTAPRSPASRQEKVARVGIWNLVVGALSSLRLLLCLKVLRGNCLCTYLSSPGKGSSSSQVSVTSFFIIERAKGRQNG